MTRFLVALFLGGLLIAAASFGAVVALGGAEPLRSIAQRYAERTDLDYGPLDADDGPSEPGAIVTREFPWAGEDDLTISLPAEVTYTQGPASKVTITAPANVLDRIRVDEDEIGVVRTTGRRDWIKDVRIVVEAPGVTSFRFNGAQKVAIEGYAQDTLKIEANGAVHVEARGTARKIELRMNGASNADLQEVVNEEARIELNGASNASVSPKTSVDIRINGVGNVSLGARPQTVKKAIHGLGSVSYTTGKSVSVGEDRDGDGDQPPRGPATDT